MSKRFNQVLINPTEEEILAREPLMAFSFYLSGRNNVLLMLGDEITELLDNGFADDGIDGTKIGRASELMWLWTLVVQLTSIDGYNLCNLIRASSVVKRQ